jgi:hypothetical protein
MIDSNTAISVPSLWAQGWRQWATDNQPWKDSLKTISWQGFEQEDGLIVFGAMKQQYSSMMRLRQAELTILIWGSKGGEICQNDNLVQNLARKCNPNKKLSHENSIVVMRL